MRMDIRLETQIWAITSSRQVTIATLALSITVPRGEPCSTFTTFYVTLQFSVAPTVMTNFDVKWQIGAPSPHDMLLPETINLPSWMPPCGRYNTMKCQRTKRDKVLSLHVKYLTTFCMLVPLKHPDSTEECYNHWPINVRINVTHYKWPDLPPR